MEESKRNAKHLKLTKQDPVYTYTELANLRSQTTANVFGVVKFFKKPFRTRGSDYCSSLSLLDPSLSAGFKCVLFTKSKDSLPSIHAVGDIVCFRQLSIGKYNGELQGANKSSEYSWMVFDGREGMPIVPRLPSSSTCVFTEQEKEQVKKLKTWGASQASLNFNSFIRTLAEIKPSPYFFNLACQVVAKQSLLKANCFVLRVWDGTLPSCQSVSLEEVCEDAWIVPSQLEKIAHGRTVDVYLYDNHIQEARTLEVGEYIYINNLQVTPQASMPLTVSMKVNKGTMYGRGISVASDIDPTIVSIKERIKALLEAPASVSLEPDVPDHSTLLSDAHSNITGDPDNRPNRSNASQPGSLTQDNKNNTRTEQTCGLICSVKEAPVARALQTSCTIASHPFIAFTSIENIKSHPTAPYKFRCRVKALMYLPNNMNDSVQESCEVCRKVFPMRHEMCEPVSTSNEGQGHSEQNITEASVPSETTVHVNHRSSASEKNITQKCLGCGGDLKQVYLFSFVLEDNTGILHVKLFDEDAVTFLPDLPRSAAKFLQNRESQELVCKKLSVLVGNREITSYPDKMGSLSNRPWLECCVKSYSVAGEVDCDRQLILYRMFDTVSS